MQCAETVRSDVARILTWGGLSLGSTLPKTSPSLNLPHYVKQNQYKNFSG